MTSNSTRRAAGDDVKGARRRPIHSAVSLLRPQSLVGATIGAILASNASGQDRSSTGLEEVVAYAAERRVVAALEPEPGMLIETLDDYAALGLPGLRLALDTGHCLVTQEREPAAAVTEFADRLGTVAIEDMARGTHIHLPFGEGDMDVAGVLDALEAINFDKLVCVELSRESHRADRMIPDSLRYLRECRR